MIYDAEDAEAISLLILSSAETTTEDSGSSTFEQTSNPSDSLTDLTTDKSEYVSAMSYLYYTLYVEVQNLSELDRLEEEICMEIENALSEDAPSYAGCVTLHFRYPHNMFYL